MKIIVPEYQISRFVKPSSQDYVALGIEMPEENGIIAPTNEEIREYVGVDLSFGIPIIKKGFFSDKSSILYAASDKDCQRLGIENKFVMFENGEVSRRSYNVEDNVAYINDSFGSLVESFARSSAIALDVLKQGAINLKFTIPGFPITGLGLRNPEVKKVLENGGTRLRDSLFPDYEAINETIPESRTTGMTSNGLEYVLY